ncbi:cytochrome c [Gaetbulibacter sp. NE]|uniref:cytochrome c n=1 Tax=Gaetbulibacter sp. NE TaxID=2982307 RepID=UPI0021D1CE99|nr:cytochrome c [Gaetbulibacter sp. NE]
MKKAIVIFTAIIVLGIALLVVVLTTNKTPVCGVEEPQNFCGTKTFYDEETSEGRAIFNTNCAACHRLNKISDPPILENNIKNYTVESFQKFVRNEERKRINQFEIECMPFPNLSNKEINNLYNYIISVTY